MDEEPQIWLLQDDELNDALRLSTQASWNQTLQDWENLLGQGLCLGGRVGRRLVCTGTLVDYGDGGWLGMLLVDEELRNRGYGTRMLNILLKAADERLNFKWVGLDATDLGRPIYLKHGFREVGTINRWEVRPKVLPQLLETREFVDPIDVSAIEKLDIEAFGAAREWKVAVNSAFHVCNENEDYLGFGRSRPGRLGRYVGPVAARSTEAATSIIAGLIQPHLGEQGIVIDVPSGSSSERWLNEQGFRIVRSWTRMIRGTAEIGKPEMIFAIAGPELG